MPSSLLSRTAPLVLTALLGLAACGDDDDDAADSTEVPSEATDGTSATTGDSDTSAPVGTGAAPDSEYCQAVRAFEEVTASFDASDVDSALATFASAASAARDVAAAAPAEIREAHDKLASAAEDLVAQLQAADPQTLEELDAVSEELLPALQDEYGDLDAETDQVEAFTAAECGST